MRTSIVEELLYRHYVIVNMVIACGGGTRLLRYPLTGYRRMSTVYGYLRTVVPMLRCMGLAPLKKTQENGITKYKAYIGIMYWFRVICVFALICYAVYHLVRNYSDKIKSLYSFNALEVFACIMFAAHVIGSKIKVIEYKVDATISIDNIFEVDNMLKKLGITTSYKYIIISTKVILGICTVCYPVLLVCTYKNESYFIILMLQIWRFTGINMFSLLVILLYTKYRKLNKFLKLYIKENEEGIPLTDTTLEPLDVINTVAEVYDKLCISGQKWNEMHNTTLSINLLFYSVGLTLYSIAYYTSPDEMVPMVPVIIYLLFEFFYVLTASQITTNECQKIMLHINEMSCCYVDNTLWRARNSFLLQTLHQRVGFTVFHVIPLDYSLAIKIGGIVISVLVLTIQIRSLEEFKE